MRALTIGLVALLLSGCAGGNGFLATSTQTFDLNGVRLTVNFVNSASGCFPLGGVLQNNRSDATGYVYAQIIASNKDGATVGYWSVNFPPAIPGGSAQSAVVTGGNGAGYPCEQLQFHAKA
jgi:hypothetical protein